MSIQINAKTRVLFIGDSITDCGQAIDPERMGNGYVRLIRDWLWAKAPGEGPVVINRGVSGNNVVDLSERWTTDVLEHRPDVLSIKVGINDVWHRIRGLSEGVVIERYVKVYRDLLKQTREALPECLFVLCEPSVIWPPSPENGNAELQPYVRAVHELGGEFKAECVVPLHGAFVEAKAAGPEIVWAPDGVHPSSTGHMLIARTWLQTTGLL